MLLPQPCREAACARWVEGWDYETVLRFLQIWWLVGHPGARYIVHEAKMMLRETMMGTDPRKRWPLRYKRESIVETYPTRGELRLVGDGGGCDGANGDREAP